jgi:hypothetical protein
VVSIGGACADQAEKRDEDAEFRSHSDTSGDFAVMKRAAHCRPRQPGSARYREKTTEVAKSTKYKAFFVFFVTFVVIDQKPYFTPNCRIRGVVPV